MALISIQSVIETIATRLRSQLTDPISGRGTKTKKWIYDDLTRVDLSSYPRMTITPGPESAERRGVGDHGTKDTYRIVIEVITTKEMKITGGAYDGLRSEQVIHKLAEDVLNVIRTSHDSTWVPAGILSIIPETNNTTYPKPGTGEEFVIKRLTLRAKVSNTA